MRQYTLKKIRFLLFLLNISGLSFLSGCQTSVPLNSERIQQRYGSYGVDVLRSDRTRRLSSLYSVTDGTPTMRTLALVDFVAADNPAVKAEHERIVAGESIGAVFKEAGWHIEKISTRICDARFGLEQLPQLERMHIELPDTLAVHTYLFQTSKKGIRVDYATITEVHHPDYLKLSELAEMQSLKAHGTVQADDECFVQAIE